MGYAKKCDRCGKFYEPYNVENDSENINGITTLNIDHKGCYFSHNVIDLCPDCKNSFEAWYKAGKLIK